MTHGLETGFLLDRQWFWLRGEMERTKRPALLALARVFADAQLSYAIISGIALQVYQSEPRTTLDIAVAVATYGQIPRSQLEASGFTFHGRFTHSENWFGPEGTPVQFTEDPALAQAIARAEEIELDEVRLRVITRVDLLYEKLRATSDPAADAPSACKTLPMSSRCSNRHQNWRRRSREKSERCLTGCRDNNPVRP